MIGFGWVGVQGVYQKIFLGAIETNWEIGKFTSVNGIWYSPQMVTIRNMKTHTKRKKIIFFERGHIIAS